MQYREEQAYIAANKDNFERMLKEEQDAMAAQMPSTFWGAAAALMGPPPEGALPGAPGAPAVPVAPTPAAAPAPSGSAPTAMGVLSSLGGGQAKTSP